MSSNAFTWFTKFGDSIDALPAEAQAEFVLAVVRYGSFGEVPEYANPYLTALFIAIREDVDNSLTKRESAKKGGRPPKKRKPKAETGFEKPETKVSETVKPKAETGFDKPETQYKPLQASTSQASTGEEGACAPAAPEGFEPPTAEEVAGYFGANCLSGDPQAFFDFYASQGWVKSNGMPIADWRPQARQWHRKQRELDADARSRGKPTASEVEAATFKPVRTPEQTLAELEERWAREHLGTEPEAVRAPRGTTADPAELRLYQDARRLLAARAAVERRAS